MNAFTFHAGSGDALYSGSILLTGGLLLFVPLRTPVHARSWWARLLGFPVVVAGAVLVTLSSAPLHPLIYSAWATAALVACAAGFRRRGETCRIARIAVIGTAMIAAVACAI